MQKAICSASKSISNRLIVPSSDSAPSFISVSFTFNFIVNAIASKTLQSESKKPDQTKLRAINIANLYLVSNSNPTKA